MVFGVNGGSMKSHQRFSEKHGFPFDLLVDAGSAVALAYDARVLHNHYTKRRRWSASTRAASWSTTGAACRARRRFSRASRARQRASSDLSPMGWA